MKEAINFFYSMSMETQGFLLTISLFTLIFHATYTQATADKAPAFLTTLGILGTFVGIAIGLINFNTMNLEASVPSLIEGIKTAVWASALGIFGALTIKLRDIEGFSKRKRPVKKTANVEELIAALRGVEQALNNMEKKATYAPVQASAPAHAPEADAAEPKAVLRRSDNTPVSF